ncbi:MAG TPA: hypothetical protein VF109_01985 [Mycobacteriales bacterium]
MPASRFLSVLGLAAVLLGAGCSAVDSVTDGADASPTTPSNGVADKPPAEILASARKALAAAGSVHVKGNGTEGGEVFAFDMRMKGTQAGRGTLTIKHNPVEILRIGKQAYLKGDADFWLESTGSRSAAELLKGKYVKGSATDPDLKETLALTSPVGFGDEALTAKGAVTKADSRKVGAVDTVGVTYRTKEGDQITVYVATTGKPYPMYLSTTGKTADKTNSFDFREYDQPLEIKPPSPDLVIDPEKLGG